MTYNAYIEGYTTLATQTTIYLKGYNSLGSLLEAVEYNVKNMKLSDSKKVVYTSNSNSYFSTNKYSKSCYGRLDPYSIVPNL